MLKKLIALFLLVPALAFADAIEPGKDYEIVSVQQDKHPQGKTQVIEFFSYGCPACYKIEPMIEQWIKSKNNLITFDRLPVAFNKNWELYAKAYYVAQTLSMLDKMTPIIFKSVHVDRQMLDTTESMIDLFVSQGANKDVVTSAFKHSLKIDLMLKNGATQLSRYQINGIPAFVINQKYKTDLQMAKSPERLAAILDYLIAIDKKNP